MTRLATATKEYTNEGYLSQTIYVLIHYIYIYIWYSRYLQIDGLDVNIDVVPGHCCLGSGISTESRLTR